MSTWTTSQIRQVRGLRVVTMLDQSVRPDVLADMLKAAKSQMVKRIVSDAYPFAVEIDGRDVGFREEQADGFRLRIEARWDPPTRKVELRDAGEHDGRVLEFRDAPSGTLMMARARDVGWAKGGASPEDVVTTRNVQFNVAGWSESSRRWIYAPS